MKKHEVKLRLVCGVNELIDIYFGDNSIKDNLINSTLKVIVKQNTYKLEPILDLFADENGDIDEHIIIEEYSRILGEKGIVIDLRDFIKSEMVQKVLPDKAIVFKSEDLIKMLSDG
jgi:methylase of polypeptide subunit release factors